MKKNYWLIVIMILAFFVYFDKIGASYECGYHLNPGQNPNFSADITVDIENNEIRMRNSSSKSVSLTYGLHYVDDILDYYIDEHYSGLDASQKTSKLIEFLNGTCPKVVAFCPIYGHPELKYFQGYGVLFNLSYSDNAVVEISESSNGQFGKYLVGEKCEYVQVVEDSVKNAEIGERNYSCLFYDKIMKGNDEENIKPLKKLYESCLSSEDKIDCYSYNSNKSTILNYCNSVINRMNYNHPCMNPCLTLTDEISIIEQPGEVNGACNVSDKIWLWIANIFKWVKYIAPALVIVLSMVDFIKSFASQSDDDMKKAQGRFVRRLIAAVLLFIIPFLLEFALDVFNLVTDNPYCNII